MEKPLTLHPLLATQCLKALDFVRESKVERLRALIAAGCYHPDPVAVAESLFVSPETCGSRSDKQSPQIAH